VGVNDIAATLVKFAKCESGEGGCLFISDRTVAELEPPRVVAPSQPRIHIERHPQVEIPHPGVQEAREWAARSQLTCLAYGVAGGNRYGCGRGGGAGVGGGGVSGGGGGGVGAVAG